MGFNQKDIVLAEKIKHSGAVCKNECIVLTTLLYGFKNWLDTVGKREPNTCADIKRIPSTSTVTVLLKRIARQVARAREYATSYDNF